jgi:hypothetical protein
LTCSRGIKHGTSDGCSFEFLEGIKTKPGSNSEDMFIFFYNNNKFNKGEKMEYFYERKNQIVWSRRENGLGRAISIIFLLISRDLVIDKAILQSPNVIIILKVLN